MQPYHRAPYLVWPGHLHGAGCLSARAMDTGFSTVVWRLCLGPGCALVWVSVTPPALAGVFGGYIWVRFVVSPLFSPLGLAVFAVGLGFRPAPHLSWLGFRDVRGCVRAPPAPCRSRFWCAVLACVLGFGFRLRPASPCRGVGVCVCLCARPVWSPAPPGWGCGAGVCSWAWVAAAPRHSWLGCWGVCVCVCAPRLYPAFPQWGVLRGRVCWARVSAAPRPSWLGCRGVCAVVRVPRLPPPLSGGRLWRGGVRLLPLWGLPPPSLLVFFWGGGFVVSVAGCPGLRSRGLCPPTPSLPGCVVCCFFFPSQDGVCPRLFGVPSPCGPLPSAWCCRCWLSGPPAPLWGVLSSVPSGWGVWPPLVVLVGGVVAVGRSRPPPLSFFRGGLPVPPFAFPGLGHALVGILCGFPVCCWWLRFARPCPGPMGRVGYVHVGLGAPSCRVRFWLCRVGGCARRLRVAVG